MRISDWSSDVCSSDLLVVGGALERGPLDAGLGRESLQRARGLAVGVEGDVEVGAEAFGRLLGLLDGDGRQQHRQSARRIERLRFAALDRDAALAELVDHPVEQPRCQARKTDRTGKWTP